MYREGMTCKQIGQQYGASVSAVSAMLIRNGETRRSNRKLPPSDVVVELYRSGLSGRAIGDIYGVAGSAVLRILKQAEEPRRCRANSGERNGRYKDGSQSRAYRSVVSKALCAKCGSSENLGIHHKDFDHYNNAESNLEVLCVGCHMSLHKTEYWAARREGREPRKSNGPVGWEENSASDRRMD
jgi:transposase